MRTNLLKRLTFNFLYLNQPRWDTGIAAPELERFIEDNQPGNALDLGCGTGTNLLYLASHGWSVTGIDFIPYAIRKAKKKLNKFQALLLAEDVARISSLDLPGPYDLILDMGCFHNLSPADRNLVSEGIRKWLIPGGMFMIYAFQPVNGSDLKGISLQDMVACFKGGFNLLGIEQGRGRLSAWYYFKRK